MIKTFDVELPERCGIKGPNPKVTGDIREFLNSSHVVAEIELDGRNAVNVTKSYYTTVWRLGLSDNIMVSRRDGRVFLIKRKAK